MILHLCTKNDKNGNPRRLFVDTETRAVFDEGYRGAHAMPENLRNKERIYIYIMPAEYRRILKGGI